jgi:acyl carrier protein
MSPTDIRQAILEILEDIQPDLDFSQLQDEVPLREQFELDSMDFLDIVMELRKRYRVEVPEEDYGQMRTMASTVAYLEPRMRDLQNV